MNPEPLDSSWYQYSTKPMRVIKITQAGVINKDGPVFVNPGDFLLALEDNE